MIWMDVYSHGKEILKDITFVLYFYVQSLYGVGVRN